MEDRKEKKADTRSDTNASLGVERAGANRATIVARRVLDDLIERDRARADARLYQFRASADSLLERERLASPTRDRAIAHERRMADEDKEQERAMTDAVRDTERGRVDAQAEQRHRKAAAARLELQHDTDGKLTAERSVADAIEHALGDASRAVGAANLQQDHRRNLLATVSHDLRGPLTVIAMSAGFLSEDPNPETQEVAQDMVRAAARMQRLLEDLLDVAGIDSGALRCVRHEHDVGELMREVNRNYRPVFADRDLTFTVSGLAEPMVAWFDHDRIVQVLSNLLGNALKFTPPGGSVELNAHPLAQSIEFEVIDTGMGIAPDALAHVFERFWQVENDERRGLGLGLYICKQIVEQHGGRIAASSVEGEGTTLRFTLPTERSANDETDPAPASHDAVHAV